MIDKEKVFKLAMKLKNSYVNQYEDAITEWLEQNQLNSDEVQDYRDEIEELERHSQELYEEGKACIKYQNELMDEIQRLKSQQKEVVVGLSDEQVFRVAKIMGYSSDSITVDRINTYLKTQTFTQSQQLFMPFSPDWTDVPDDIVLWRVCFEWLNENHNVVRSDVLQPEIKRPKPTQQVEVGQVWMHKNTLNEYYIKSLGQMKFNGEWHDSVTYEYDETDEFTRPLSDFLAKFERVGGLDGNV
jgi:hypothetical protein